MLVAFAKLLPIALAGAFLPTWTSYVILLLGTDRPVATSLAFVAGNATYRFLLGFGLLFLFTTEALKTAIGRLPDPGPWLEITAGVALVVIGLTIARSRARAAPDPDRSLPKWMRAYEKVPPIVVFGWAFLSVASPGIQYVYLLAAVAVIGRAGVGPVEQVVLLAAWVALVQAMLLAPVGLYAWKRDRAEPVLERAKRWIATTGTAIFSWVFIVLGTGIVIWSAYTAFLK